MSPEKDRFVTRLEELATDIELTDDLDDINGHMWEIRELMEDFQDHLDSQEE